MMLFFYRALLRGCPVDVRQHVGDEMIAMARYGVELEAQRYGAVGRAWGIARSFIDLLMFVVTSRRDARHQRHYPHQTQPSSHGRSFMTLRDLRSALRLIRRQPMFSLAVAAMLALGIGSTAAIYSVVYCVLLKPLELPEPDRIVQIYGSMKKQSIDTMSLAEANVWDIADKSRAFIAIGGAHSAAYTLTGLGDAPERVIGARVNVGFLRALGAPPLAGRLFDVGEDAPGAVAERVVLGERLWARRFGRSPSVIGQTITMSGRSYEVVGVVPHGPWWLDDTDVFVPLLRGTKMDRDSWEYDMAARLRPGVTMAAAQSDLDSVAAGLQIYKENEGLGIVMRPSDDWAASPDLRRTLWIMLGAVILLLAIASVNVTNLMLVNASARARDRAVRIALGASRGDLVRESLTESLLLTACGVIGGAILAFAMLKVFKTADPGGIPRLADVQLNAYVWMFTLAIAILVAVVTGLIPALRTPFANIVTALREGQRGSIGDRRQDRTRAMFVAAEVALSVVLLIGAGLLARSLVNTLTVDRGFATDHRLTAEVTLPGAYTGAKRAEINTRILADLGALPDVVNVASVSGAMLSGGGTGMKFAAAGSSVDVSQVPWATWRLISKDYFPSIGLSLVSGRAFDEHDTIGKPWRVVISSRLAQRVWPGQNAVGQTATLWKGQNESTAEVIGVVSDMREHRLDDDPTMTVYMPVYGGPMSSTSLRLVVHTRTDPERVIAPLRAVIGKIDPSLPISRTRAVAQMVNESVATRRFTMMLLITFAGLALLLALAGVAGVLMYSMARRTGEMGLRLALGARPGGLVALVVRQGLLPVAVGLVIGLGAAYWLSKLMANLLYAVKPADPFTYAASLAVLLSAAALACYFPARRVLHIEPCTALRE